MNYDESMKFFMNNTNLTTLPNSLISNQLMKFYNWKKLIVNEFPNHVCCV